MKTATSRKNQMILLLVLSLLLPVAIAQGSFDDARVSGTIHGSLGESESIWQIVELELPDGVYSTASYSVTMDTMYFFSVQGNAEGQLVEGAINLSFNTFNGPLVDCPCVLTGEITHWTTSSMFGKLFTAEDATITVLAAELLPDGAYRLTGTAEAELFYYEDIFTPETSGDPVPVSLEFSVDRVVPEDLDLD